MDTTLPTGRVEAVRQQVIDAGRRYWPRGDEPLRTLPIPAAPWAGSAAVTLVPVPEWATDLGVGTPPALLVHADCLPDGPDAPWERCDWWSACFAYLDGALERAHERRHGPVHSYALRLRDQDPRMFDHAWVNRILLLLRRQAARAADRTEHDLFGPLPDPVIDLTHDVDAVTKTGAVRVKQSVFHLFNAGRALARGRARRTLASAGAAARFLVSGADYWCFPTITDLEERHGRRSTFHFYGGPPGHARTAKQRLMDPAYDVRDPRLRAELRRLHDGGWTVGVHPAYDTWRSVERLGSEIARVEEAADTSVTRCRQHWLRFAWAETWRAQAACDLRLDATLGFNDRPGFRTGAALRYRPWDEPAKRPMTLEVLPLVLMDSHLFDYAAMAPDDRLAAMQRWIDEVRTVHGEASVVWHQRVMHPDYGWAPEYERLLEVIP